jgi:RNA polymerase sigma-70 factor, ECF subfamily
MHASDTYQRRKHAATTHNGDMPSWRLPDQAVTYLYQTAHADRWGVPSASFAAALERCAHKAFTTPPDTRELERYLASLHLADLALACACETGHEGAWEHFVREHRPALYRAADAIDPSGGSRDLADALYGELFGLIEREGERRSLFKYFHGRSSLSTWLRAVLAQRHVDRVRSARRFEPLPAEDGPHPLTQLEPDQARATGYTQLMRRAVTAAVARLAPKDKLRLAYYYAQDLTLAQIGRTLGEHEATVSRNLARARREIRAGVERQLRDDEHMSAARIEECFAAVVDDVGSLDVTDLLGTTADGADPSAARSGARKDGEGERSKERPEGASA